MTEPDPGMTYLARSYQLLLSVLVDTLHVDEGLEEILISEGHHDRLLGGLVGALDVQSGLHAIIPKPSIEAEPETRTSPELQHSALTAILESISSSSRARLTLCGTLQPHRHLDAALDLTAEIRDLLLQLQATPANTFPTLVIVSLQQIIPEIGQSHQLAIEAAAAFSESLGDTTSVATHHCDPKEMVVRGGPPAVEVPSSGLLTVAAVARRLGVAPSTLRTWDRRYGLGPSGMTSESRRRYTPDDLHRLIVMRGLVMEGVASAEAAKIALSTPVHGGEHPEDSGDPKVAPPKSQEQDNTTGVTSKEILFAIEMLLALILDRLHDSTRVLHAPDVNQNQVSVGQKDFARMLDILLKANTQLSQDIEELRQALTDFSGRDLRDCDLTGLSLDGMRWSRALHSWTTTATLWPSDWIERIERSSIEIGPGFYEIREGGVPSDLSLVGGS